jgi:protein-L-isoaspartate(D-aspartate) O-methyltransferase
MPPLSDEADREATAQFLMRLRGRGVRDIAVLRALEATPRRLFTPQKYRDLAFREMALPIACGQEMPDPFFVARLAADAAIGPLHRVLEIGAGSGFCTAVFARLASEVLSIERWRSLAIEARTRLETLGVANAACVWADGRDAATAAGRFERIVVHAALAPADRDRLASALAPEGALIAGDAQSGAAGEVDLVRWTLAGDGDWRGERLGRARLRRLESGMSAAL